jgi:FHA domain
VSPPAAGLRLEVISGNAVGAEIVVDEQLVIGRHAEGAGQLSEDPEISRQHARITREASGEYAIEDLGSSNGTFVNGLRIQSPRLLSPGDSIEAGATTLLVREIVKPAASRTAISAVPETVPSEAHAPTTFARTPPIVGPPTPLAPARPEPSPVPPVPPVPAPAAPASPEPAPVAPPPLDATPAPPLALRLEVDFDARRATVALGEEGQAIELSYEDGRWQARPTDERDRSKP